MVELEQPPWTERVSHCRVITCTWGWVLTGRATANLLPPGTAPLACAEGEWNPKRAHVKHSRVLSDSSIVEGKSPLQLQSVDL